MAFHLLKSKGNLLSIRNHFVPRSKHFSVTGYKTQSVNAVYSKSRCLFRDFTKHSTQSEHHVEFLNAKPGGT